MANVLSLYPETELLEDILKAVSRLQPSDAQALSLRLALRAYPLILTPAMNIDQRVQKSLALNAFRRICLLWNLIDKQQAYVPPSETIGGVARTNPQVTIAWEASRVAILAYQTWSTTNNSFTHSRTKSAIKQSIDAYSRYSLEAGLEPEELLQAVVNELSWDIKRVVDNPNGLLFEPIWTRAPKLIGNLQREAYSRLTSFGDNWDFAARWLSDATSGKIAGDFGSSPVSNELLDHMMWARKPEYALSRLVELTRGRTADSDVESIVQKTTERLTQVSASFQFTVNPNGPIDAKPLLASTSSAFVNATLGEAIEKANSLLSQLTTTDAAPRVTRSIERLLGTLDTIGDDLNPALLRSRTRSIEADGIAYVASGSNAELFPHAISEILDLVGTLKDLQSCFPEIIEVERNAAAIEIAGKEEEVRKSIGEIALSARQLSANYPTIVTERAVDAVAIFNDDILDAPTVEVQQQHLAHAVLVTRNFVTAAYRKVLQPTGIEALRVAKIHYEAAINGSVSGTQAAAKKAPEAALAFYLAGWMGVAAVFLKDVLPLQNAKAITEKLSKDTSAQPEPHLRDANTD